MSLGTQTVGAEQILKTVHQDPNTASSQASVLAVGDGQNLAGLFAALVESSGLLLNAGGNMDRQRAAPGATGIPSVNTEGTKATYSVGIIGFTPVATPTDFLTLIGSATKTGRLLRMAISGVANAAISVDLQLIKRTAADTGGASSQPVLGQHDSNDPAPTCVVNQYSANPAGLGTSGGVVRAQKLNLGVTGAAGQIVWDFTTRNSKGLVLRGVAQLYALNWNGAAVPAGTLLDIDLEFSEE